MILQSEFFVAVTFVIICLVFNPSFIPVQYLVKSNDTSKIFGPRVTVSFTCKGFDQKWFFHKMKQKNSLNFDHATGQRD